MIVASRFSMKNAPATSTARARENPSDPDRGAGAGGEVTRPPCQERSTHTGRTIVRPGSGPSRTWADQGMSVPGRPDARGNTMALSEGEQRRLDEIAAGLTIEDPTFAQRIT